MYKTYIWSDFALLSLKRNVAPLNDEDVIL